MAIFAQAEIRSLEAELQYTPRKLRQAHLKRLIKLIPELDTDRLYTYEYVFYRVTQFRPDTNADRVSSGRSLRHDLGLLLRRLSPDVPLPAGAALDSILPIQLIASESRVTPKTVRRWGLLGLPLCMYLLDGGVRQWAVRRPELGRFLEQRRAQHPKPSRRIESDERREILARARTLRRKSGLAPGAVVRCLAHESGRSAATIRRLLRKDEQERAATSPVPPARPGLAAEKRDDLVSRYRAGVPARSLAKRFGRSVATIYRILHRALVEQTLALKISYVPSPEFAGARAGKTCLGQDGLFTYPPEVTPDMPKAPQGLPPYLSALYRIPLLARDQEKVLFRKYNYIKCRAAILQERIRCKGYRAPLLEAFEAHRQAAEAVRRILIRCNLRLVVSIAKRHVGPLATLPELISEGNMCLIRAVECYDYRREARFATYATWALSKHFARCVPERNYRLATFVTGQHEMIDALGDKRPSPHLRPELVAHIRTVVARAARTLTDRERAIIASHFGTDGKPARTLEEIGKLFGVTRERVRQIEARALQKLREVINPEAIEGLT